MTRLIIALVPLTLAATAQAQEGGLSGPSSVAADLDPGDELTDPQLR